MLYRVEAWKMIARMNDQVWMTVAEVASAASVEKVTVRRWIAAKQLAAHRIPSGTYRVERAEFLRFMNSQQAASHAG